ncbi:hypothetical protein ACFL25_00190 [Patescibacteria group bacterium]
MKKVYVVNGLPDSGKTLFGVLVAERLTESGVNFLHTSSINPVKQLLMPEGEWSQEFRQDGLVKDLRRMKAEVTDRDWDGETKDDYWRKAMSDLKAKLAEYDPNFVHSWVLARALQIEEPCVVFVDIREPHNIQGFKEYCQFASPEMEVKSVWLESDLGREFANLSDGWGIIEYTYDIRVRNNRREFGGDEERQLAAFKDEVNSFVERHVVDRARTKEVI